MYRGSRVDRISQAVPLTVFERESAVPWKPTSRRPLIPRSNCCGMSKGQDGPACLPQEDANQCAHRNRLHGDVHHASRVRLQSDFTHGGQSAIKTCGHRRLRICIWNSSRDGTWISMPEVLTARQRRQIHRSCCHPRTVTPSATGRWAGERARVSSMGDALLGLAHGRRT